MRQLGEDVRGQGRLGARAEYEDPDGRGGQAGFRGRGRVLVARVEGVPQGCAGRENGEFFVLERFNKNGRDGPMRDRSPSGKRRWFLTV